MKSPHPSIAIVGLACAYPDAGTPTELWENVLAQRRAFRRLPPERFRTEDYWSADATAPDRTYSTQGAVIAGYEFDRVAFRVVGSTYRSADLTHWLALDVASRALADAGFPEGRGLPRETTGVLLGNTLTGEFSRASVMRLRWPYVRRVLDSALSKENWTSEARHDFLERLEEDYKSPFPAVGEETLAGGLSNTIAGRICNQFDLKGGGYTVDGACASSLLAVANACSALMAGDLDVALAGGVDLSLDPFELVGFAKTGALARDEMRVYDRRSAGFWPGEGCGFVTLMRHQDALAQGCRVYAVIRGWGISSDGSGGITRPEADGQMEAIRRAYRRAGFGIDSVAYFEGHGTGTAVGDSTELEVLTRARREAKVDAPSAALGSIKANIGHTKAAAGIAGLLKAVLALHKQVLPPTTGAEQPHEKLSGPAAPLRLLREAERWPEERFLRAAVSAMGFGGINAHIVLENPVHDRRSSLSPRERELSRSHQDAELFLLAAATPSDLASLVDKLLNLAVGLSRSELADLAAELQRNLPGTAAIRAAVVASTPAELTNRLTTLRSWLRTNDDLGEPAFLPARLPANRHSGNGLEAAKLKSDEGLFLSYRQTPPRIGFLFPGQGSPTHLDGGIWKRRFESVRQVYAQAALPAEGDSVSTRVMQPAVVTASLAGLKVLQAFGIEATTAIGHSLGEITALHWSGVIDEETLLRIARVRGAAMADLGSPTGAMLAIGAAWPKVQALLDGEPLAIVGYNSPRQTVVAGDITAIGSLAQRARANGWQANSLPVSHAFHTPLVAAAVPILAEQLAREHFAPSKRPFVSTITGGPLDEKEDLRALLCRQVTSPVRFADALGALLGGEKRSIIDDPKSGAIIQERLDPPGVDLLIEVGPGTVLTGLVLDTTEVTALPLDAGGPSLKGLLQVLGAAFALGAPVRTVALFADRFTRPFALDSKPKFFVNPCELAPVTEESGRRKAEGGMEVGLQKNRVAEREMGPVPTLELNLALGNDTAIDLVRQLVAHRAELPLAAVQDSSRMLSDLHLNSITAGQLVSEAARTLGLPRIVGLTDFANASVAEIARALEELKLAGGKPSHEDSRTQPPGVDVWFESFITEYVDRPRPPSSSLIVNHQSSSTAQWHVFAPEQHPLAVRLREKLAAAGGQGVLVCLPEAPTENHLDLLLEGARAVMDLKDEPRFVLVQHGWGGAGFARTLHLEMPGVITCIVDVPLHHPQSVDWIVAEALSASGFTEAWYDSKGHRRAPRLTWLPERRSSLRHIARNLERADLAADASFPIGPSDILLVSGGGKGIAAECSLALAQATGARLALMGRADPAMDKEVKNHLARIAGAGVTCCYVRADVTDAQSVRTAIVEAEKKLGGPITALLHGAGTNSPQLIGALDVAAFKQTLAPKIQGARNLLAAIDPERLRLFITFSSIIARAGLAGEAHYATANEWLTALTEEFQSSHPQCRCLALEWSVWSGLGMGERLGRMESLIQQGITPIPPDEGVRILLELLRDSNSASCRSGLPDPDHVSLGEAIVSTSSTNGNGHAPKESRPPVAVVVTSRFGEPPTLKQDEPELPLRRFLERQRVYYPGVELIVDAELSLATDPYLADHVVQKQKLFPAVFGLEAMAQAAMALARSDLVPIFEKVELTRPIPVSGNHSAIIRLAALRRGPDLIEVCLRSEETDFQVDHFRAFCRFETVNDDSVAFFGPARVSAHRPSMEPMQDLYDRILFHRGRFCRLKNYRLITAQECIAEIKPDSSAPWFGPYSPGTFVLGDPGARDAALHAIQACIPHRRILPTGIDRVVVKRSESGTRIVRAKERLREGNNFIYDVEITDAQGELIEHWQGLRLRAVEEMTRADCWPESLLAPYLERRVEELVPHSSVRVVLEHNGAGRLIAHDFTQSRSAASDTAIQNAVGQSVQISRRPDGKPVTAGGECFSVAHAQELTLAVAADKGVACDLELAAPRSTAVWLDLLGEARLSLAQRISREHAEEIDVSATRLWSVIECMKKAGLPAEAPLVLANGSADGWVLFRAGAFAIATCATPLQGIKAPLIVAIAVYSNGTQQLAAALEKAAV